MRTGDQNLLSVAQTGQAGQRGRQEGSEIPKNKVTLLDQDIRWICQEHRAKLGYEPRDMAKKR